MKNKYHYDLHIHSCLSPCSDDDMTIRNIVHMAMLKGLDLIAICDHNTTKQLKNAKKYALGKIYFIYGIEIQTKEKIHVLAYFTKDHLIDAFQAYLDQHLIYEPNRIDYYGHQLILDENDQIVGEEKALLISSLDLSIKEVIHDIKRLGGIAVLAHVERKYGYLYVNHQLDFDLPFDGVELDPSRVEVILEKYPELLSKYIFHNSDAHELGMIHEPLYEISMQSLKQLFKES